MKSTKQELEKRGKISELESSDFSVEEALQQLNHTSATTRTHAISILEKYYQYQNKDILLLLLHHLEKEQALYTRLQITNFLKNGNQEVATLMLPFLGKIGNNQYKTIGNPSKKRSYPLPRDLIARTLAHMTPDICDLLYSILPSMMREQQLEVIDAIGFLTFYHHELVTQQHFEIIESLSYTEDELLLWKIVTCLSAFPTLEGKQLLNEIKDRTNNLKIKAECIRSLSLIGEIV